MKKTSCSAMIFFLILFLNFPSLANVEEDIEIRLALTDWEQSIDSVPIQYNPDNLSMLGQALRKLSRPRPSYQEWRNELYLNARLKTTSIPGHAEYFANRIREAYEPLKGPNPNLAINHAQTEMMLNFETLKHLPSPETVRVLGEMLSETWELPPNGDYTPPALAHSAMTTLGDLGIRDAPWRPIITTTFDLPGAIPAWQAWWEQVSSGQRAFSFKGQSVEYRFKPDGSWETTSILSPPDDGPKSPKAESVDRKQPAESPDAKGISTQSDSWPWVVGWTIGLLVIGLWLWVKRR